MRPLRKRSERLTWVEQTLGRGARVVATRPLTGGLTSLVHELTVMRNGRRSRYVLRSWARDNEHQDWIQRAVADGPDWKNFLPLQIDGRAPLEVEGMTRRMEDLLTLVLPRT